MKARTLIVLTVLAILAPTFIAYASTKTQKIYEQLTLTITEADSGASSLSKVLKQLVTLTITEADTGVSALSKRLKQLVTLTITEAGISAKSKVLKQTITLTIQAGTIAVNGAFSINNADDTDHLYAQYKNYQITSVSSIPGGYAEIKTVTIGFYHGSTLRASILYTEDTDTFSQPSGSTYLAYVADGSGAVRSGNTITLTINFAVKWGASTEGLILKQDLVTTNNLTDSDYNTDSNYLVVRDLKLSNLSASIADTTHVTYTGNISYFGSSLYPPDDEFTKIHIHNSAHVSQANEDVASGAFSVEIEYSSSPANYIYHYYLNMADADYTDADLDGGLITTIISSGGGGSVSLLVTGDATITLDGAPVTTPHTYTLTAGSSYTLDADDIPGAGSASGSWMIFLLILVPIGYILLSKRR